MVHEKAQFGQRDRNRGKWYWRHDVQLRFVLLVIYVISQPRIRVVRRVLSADRPSDMADTLTLSKTANADSCLPIATNAMIESLGVGWAFRILGVVAFTVNVICAILMKDRNKAIGSSQLAFDYRLFKRVEFWLTLGWGFFSMLGYIVLLFSLPNYAISVSLPL